MKKDNNKKYKLIKDYPENTFPVGDLVFKRDGMYYDDKSGVNYHFNCKDIENYPEFWEEQL